MKEISMKAISIKAISITEVREFDKIKYNTNNHWVDNIRPNDYDEVIQNTHTNKWIYNFRKNEDITILEINAKYDIYWMKKSFEIGSQTKRFPNQFIEDLEDMDTKFKILTSGIFDNERKWFIRSESVSLKEGIHGTGPYTNFKNVIESIVTCSRGHTAIKPDVENQKIILYLTPWIQEFENKETQEFRIFVCNNKITAISQQDLYKVNTYLDNLNEIERTEKINEWCNIILEYFENIIKTKITHLSSYVIDLALLKKNKNTVYSGTYESYESYEPYFIEINSFGKEYAAGSALFGWIQDEDVLYGRKNNVDNQDNQDNQYLEFRYTSN